VSARFLKGVFQTVDPLILTPHPPHDLKPHAAAILPGRTTRRRLGLNLGGSPNPAAAAQRALSRASTVSSSDLTRRCHSPRGRPAASHLSGGSGGGADRWEGGDGDGDDGGDDKRGEPSIRVIVAGCGPARRKGLLEGFQEHAPAGSTVTFVHSDGSSAAPASAPGSSSAGGCGSCGAPNGFGRLHSASTEEGATGGTAAGEGDGSASDGLRVSEVVAPSPISSEALIAAGLPEADALVISSCGGGAAPGGGAQAADALLMCELLAVQEALEACGGRQQHGLQQQQHSSQQQQNESQQQQQQRKGEAEEEQEGQQGRTPFGGVRGFDDGGDRQVSTAAGVRRQLHVVCLVRSYGMRRTAQAFLRSLSRRAFSFELLIADELVAAALVQIATHPHNSLVFDRLLLNRRGGTRLTMIPATAYGFGLGSSADAGGASGGGSSGSGGGIAAATFGTVAEAVLKHRVLAVGYRRADGRLLLAPSPDEVVDWVTGDELVALVDEDP
jgi:hypothetical protein